ncbi:MAG: sodium/proline symporter [Nannocystaceae bacterium]|nr:sodium/proline symporter [Myxococcales bacterium]
MDEGLVAKTLAIVLYGGILLVIGALASRRMKDLRDYFAAGKRLGYWSVAFSARATGESAWLLLGLTGMGAYVGVKAFWVVIGEVLGVGLSWLWMARPFKRLTDHHDAITIPDYLEGRLADHGQGLRRIAAAALVVFVSIFVSAQIDATGQAFEQFLGWDYYVGAIAGFLVVLLYIASGGFLAVVWSDVFQGALMVAGLVFLPIAAIVHAGGVAPIVAGLRAIDPNLLSPTGGEGVTLSSIASVVGLVAIGLGFLGSPQIFARFLALRDEAEIRRGAAVAITWTVLADSGAVLVGLVGRHLLAGAELGPSGQAVLPQLVDALFPPLLVGVYIAIVLAAIMSTIDSLLVVAGSAAVRDYYQKIRHPELDDRSLVRASRGATVALAGLALALALVVASVTEERSIFWFIIFGWSGIAATFCPTMILSLFWSRFTARGARWAMISGFTCVPLFKFVAPRLPAIGPYFARAEELAPAFLVSLIVGVIVSLSERASR